MVNVSTTCDTLGLCLPLPASQNMHKILAKGQLVVDVGGLLFKESSMKGDGPFKI